jgi:hypothetical protein
MNLQEKKFKSVLKKLKPNDNIDELLELHRQPNAEKNKDVPTFQDFKPNYTHQADILYLPTAKYGFKYLLVVVDDHTRKFDAIPLKTESSNAVLNGFKKIYEESKYLKLPKMFEFDAGTAFHGEVEKYFNNLGIHIRYAPTNRHRMQALVEAKNQLLGNIIHQILNLKELTDKKSGINKESVDWYQSKEEFEKLINTLNEHSTYKPLKTQISDAPIVTKANRDLLNEGDRVRVLLDYPINIAHKNKQIGKFRSADIRWSLEVHKIQDVILKPGQPPLYRIVGENHLRTRQQLQLVK